MVAGAHSVVQLLMRRPVDGPVCQPVHDIVQAFVHDKMDRTEGFKDT